MKDKSIPRILDEEWSLRLRHFVEITTEEQSQWLLSLVEDKNSFSFHLKRCWSCSEFVAMWCSKNPELFIELVNSGELYRSYKKDEIDQHLASDLKKVTNEDGLFRVLRQFRNREIVRIIWRDFNREADLEETTSDMTALAETSIQHALDFLYRDACEVSGTPVNLNGEPQKMIVLGMGNLGGWELNVSSDIDLIFSYPEQGKTHGGQCNLSNDEFFIRLSQKLIKSLDKKTDDGFVFRVDMRLRPYGQSGSLALSFAAMEEYYQTQGRDWERYAMIKARIIAGEKEDAAVLMGILRQFTFRKYIDFSSLESLRKMKILINREVQRKDISENIKIGYGGIREIEFVAQAYQIIYGGRDIRFQTQALKEILILIGKVSLLSEPEVSRLQKSYKFLRDVEHILQGMYDIQTHTLPNIKKEQLKLAYLMSFSSWDKFSVALNNRRCEVQGIFKSVIASQSSSDKNDDDKNELIQADEIWQCEIVEDVTSKLHSLGYKKPEDAYILIQALKQDRSILFMSKDAKMRLDMLMPDLILACSNHENERLTLSRVLKLIQSIARRSAYLVLLKENPGVLNITLQLCSASPWISEQLSKNPALLDELLDHRTLYTLPNKEELIDELRQQLLRVPSNDLEKQMETLRYFKLSHSLHVAACEVTDILPLMKVSDYLTSIAEAILTHTVEIAWDQMLKKYGEPIGKNEEKSDFLIIGYGKLGSIELGHNSDLDLVFIYDANRNDQTDGEKSIDNETFFIRLGQKIIHILMARLASGVLYEVDVRLRPSGRSGMLVSSLDAFEKYQLNDAWTWEHQALVRARPIVGSPKLIEKFRTIRSKILSKTRDQVQLITDVSNMRKKMLEQLKSKKRISIKPQKGLNGGLMGKNKPMFDIKHDEGGIIDIEFIVQAKVLSHAHQFADLTCWSDNMRIIDSLEINSIFSFEEAKSLREAYITYRTLGHRLQLQNTPLLVDPETSSIQRKEVAAIWKKLQKISKVNK
jgi:glutamate-ammonia-ligase adenylyltransferase